MCYRLTYIDKTIEMKTKNNHEFNLTFYCIIIFKRIFYTITKCKIFHKYISINK